MGKKSYQTSKQKFMKPINFGALVKWISGDNINVNKKYTLFIQGIR